MVMVMVIMLAMVMVMAMDTGDRCVVRIIWRISWIWWKK